MEQIATDSELMLLQRAAAPPDPHGGQDTAELSAYDRHKLDSARRSRAKSKAGRDIGPVPPVDDQDKRTRCETDLRFFLETVFPEAFRLGWCSDHLILIEQLQKVILEGGFRAIGMPRGTGKSTIVMRAMLWAICIRRHSYAVLCAANSGKAEKLLRALVVELESNRQLLALFPEVAFPFVALEGVANRARGQLFRGESTNISTNNKKICFATLQGYPGTGAIIEAAGIQEAVRGAVHTLPDGRVIRPSLLLCDDFQTRESANSPLQSNNRIEMIQNDLVGMAGPDSSFCALVTCTVIRKDDAADRLLNPELHPDWVGIRRKFMPDMPTDMKLWGQYSEIRALSLREHGDIRNATKFYVENRGAMDAGASVAWEARYSADRGEISAVQHAMEWYYRSRSGFYSELQNEPESETTTEKSWLTASDLLDGRNISVPRGVVPQATRQLVASVDVQGKLLYYVVTALQPDGTAHVVRYGTWPEQSDSYFTLKEARVKLANKYKQRSEAGALSQGITDCVNWLFEREFVTEDGGAFPMQLVSVDARWKKTLVVQALNRSRHKARAFAYMGQPFRAAEKPINERRYSDKDSKGLGWVIPKRRNKDDVRQLTVDVNFWKTQLADQFATPIGLPGAVTTYDGKHRMFADHVTAEYATETFGRGRIVYEWKIKPGHTENHWLDCTVGTLVLGAVLGCMVPEVSEATKAKTTRRKRKRRTVKL